MPTGRTQAKEKSGIEHGVDVDAPETFTDQGQTGLTAEVVGEFFDEEFDHGDLHIKGEDHMGHKELTSMVKCIK